MPCWFRPAHVGLDSRMAYGGQAAVSSDGIPELAEKLNHLFLTVPAPTRSGQYSNDSAAAALEERGVTVSGVHISHLRTGRRDNPSARLLAALAELFGVPISYFFDSTMEEQINSRTAGSARRAERPGQELMLRAQDVSPQSMEHLEGILDRIRQIEGLDNNGKKPKK